jgi:hypothetical protein
MTTVLRGDDLASLIGPVRLRILARPPALVTDFCAAPTCCESGLQPASASLSESCQVVPTQSQLCVTVLIGQRHAWCVRLVPYQRGCSMYRVRENFGTHASERHLVYALKMRARAAAPCWPRRRRAKPSGAQRRLLVGHIPSVSGLIGATCTRCGISHDHAASCAFCEVSCHLPQGGSLARQGAPDHWLQAQPVAPSRQCKVPPLSSLLAGC